MIPQDDQGDNSFRRFEILKKHIRFKGHTLVDIGCAYGYFCDMFIREGGKKAVGIENDLKRLEECKTIPRSEVQFFESVNGISGVFDYGLYLSLHGNNGTNFIPWLKEHARVLFASTAGNKEEVPFLTAKLYKELSDVYTNVEAIGFTPYAGRIIYKCF